MPFVDHFITTFPGNPWDLFYQAGDHKIFPYGPIMLYSLSIGNILVSPFRLIFENSPFISSLGFTTTFLIFDFAIYRIFCSWFSVDIEKIFYLYFCSPIVIYITYVHGQLDIIPIFFVLISLKYLLENKYLLAAVLLGFAINAKLSSLVILPFIVVYVFKRERFRESITFVGVSLLTYFLLSLPFLFTESFQNMVLVAEEQTWVFDLSIQYLDHDLSIMIMPVFLGVLFVNYCSYGRISKETMVMFSGLGFMMLVTFVKPMPGWYLWSYPFIVYAFLKYDDFPRFPIYALVGAYFCYFLLYNESTVVDSFGLLMPSLANMSVEQFLLWQSGARINAILFIPLVSSMMYMMFIIYMLGIKSNKLFGFRLRPHVIGIGGDSGTGKHTVANILRQIFNEDQTIQINGDADHKWERGHRMWSSFTHLNPQANNLFVQFEQTHKLKKGRSIKRIEYDHNTGKFTAPRPVSPGKFLLFVGLHPYYIPQMRGLFDLKIFMVPNEDLRRKWKIERDTQKRSYSQSEIMKQINSRIKDSSKYIQPQAQFADLQISYRSISEDGDIEVVDYLISTHLNIEPFLEYFDREESERYSVQHAYTENFDRQCITVSGCFEPTFFLKYTRQNQGMFDERFNREFQFSSDINGFTQCLVLYLICQIDNLKYE